MFRLIKWAYNLGQYQERQRIKIEIFECRKEIVEQFRGYEFDPRNDIKAKKEKREQLEKEMVINRRVDEVLEKLVRPRGEWVEHGNAPIDGNK